MGFFKRMLSMGSKRGKKKNGAKTNDIPPVPTHVAMQEEEQEAAMTRLLRSSSARYAVVAEIDYATIPPMPHPINTVIHSAAASTTSLNSTTQRGTYTVTVHRRKEPPRIPETTRRNPSHDRPESPGNQTHLRDNSQLIKLRADPSVVSLLNMYDQHGQIPDQAFSNTPEDKKESERAQKRRNGSTLRQLLGDPLELAPKKPADFNTTEGDISWAERFIRESDANSSTSSLALHTPNDFEAHFTNVHHDTSFSTDYDISATAYDNPAISSMEVELSIGADSSILPTQYPYPSLASNQYQTTVVEPCTPQRASDVFGFLTEKRRSSLNEDKGRDLPQLPSAFSTPSDRTDSPRAANNAPRSHFSSDSAESNSPMSLSSAASDTLAKPFTTEAQSLAHFQFPLLHAREQSGRTAVSRSRATSSEPLIYQTPPTQLAQDAVQVLLHRQSTQVLNDTVNGPNQVIVTAPTPCDPRAITPGPSRIPRGPRMQATKSESNTQRPMFAGRSKSTNSTSTFSNSLNSKDVFKTLPVPSRHRKTVMARRASTSSSVLTANHTSTPFELEPQMAVFRPKREAHLILPAPDMEKENALPTHSNRHSGLFSTPIRANSLTQNFSSELPLFRRSILDKSIYNPPSPASSSEMSPVGQKLMMDLRQQRMKAREAERRKSRTGSGRSGSRS